MTARTRRTTAAFMLMVALTLVLELSAFARPGQTTEELLAAKDAEIARLNRVIAALEAKLAQLTTPKPPITLPPRGNEVPPSPIVIPNDKPVAPSVSPPRTPATTPAPAPAPDGSWLSRDVLWILVISALGIGGVLIWFLVIVPRRRRRPLVEAGALLASGQPDDHSKAESLLVEALTAGLSSADVADARFQLAYVRAQLERYAEAEATLADLEKTRALTKEAAYLLLWVLARQRKHQEVERLYERHSMLLRDVLQSRHIFSVTFLHLGRKSLALRETAVALDYFDRVRTLRVLADQIPADLANHHLVFGLGAAFEQKWEEARKQFSAAANSAGGADNAASVNARLALLVCDWRQNPKADLDAELTALLPAVATAHEKAVEAAKDKPDSPSNQRDRHGKSDAPTEDATLLLSACRVWHLYALLRAWGHRPDQRAPDKAERAALATRIDAVKQIAPRLCEPWLVEGLIDFYFAGADPAARVRAVELLNQAVEREMAVPEVLMLLEREKEQQRMMREGRPTYLKLLRSYLHNGEVSETVRREVRARLQQFERFKDIEDADVGASDTYMAPSIPDLQTRVDIMHRRVAELIRPRLAVTPDQHASEELDELTRDIADTNAAVRTHVTHLEEAEGRLTVYAGEILLSEESSPAEEAEK